MGKFVMLVLAAMLCCWGCVSREKARTDMRELVLSDGGKSAYVVVPPASPTAIDEFAVKELAQFLKQATGAEFRVAASGDTAPAAKRIFVGLSALAMNILSDDPLRGMENQEHAAKSVGDDIFLYGKGPHGNLYAVYDFLENSVGCRWYSAFGDTKIPALKSLRLQAFDRRSNPAFPARTSYTDTFFLRPDAMLFLYRNGANLDVARHAKEFPGIVDELKTIPPSCHTVFSYIPPQEIEKKGRGFNPPLKFLRNKDYFKSNPEFFSMDKAGKRIDDLQLCFSNKELRRTLTENIEENIKLNGGKGVVAVEANDTPGHFCYCPECATLEKQYGCIGGPLFDYLVELCGVLKERRPEVYVKSLVYRKEQTQKPPKVDKLPDNLIPIFAPIDDNFAADWSHPSNAETYQDLQEWCRLAKNVWVWYYPNPYVSGFPPFGNIERLVADIRMMRQAGVKGIFFEHDVGVTEGLGFTELQTYLELKLMWNPTQDAAALAAEFMDYQYGKAAPLMRQYLDDLERHRKEMRHSISWNPSTGGFKYLTPDNLSRWERGFDEMEELTKGNPKTLFNVQQVRVILDRAVLLNWQQASKKHPDYFKGAKFFESRIHATYDRMIKEHVSTSLSSSGNILRKRFYDNLDTTMLFAENPGKPLPEMFAGISEEKIKRVVPTVYQKQRLKDDDAAFGITGESVSETPFKFGFYDGFNKKFVLDKTLQLSEIKPGIYAIYKLGAVELTPDCLVWLAASSWAVSAKLEGFYEPGVPNKWDTYVSMKFEGPSYQKDAKLGKDRVLCDQVVLVKAE